METWFASHTATKPEITERKECSSPGGGVGGGGGGAGRVLAEVACGRGCDEGPRKRLKASSGTEGSSRGPCCAQLHRWERPVLEQRQQELGDNRSHTMEREFTVDWMEENSTTKTTASTGSAPMVNSEPNTPCGLSFQTDARFSYVVETSSCNEGVHSGAIHVGRHLLEACETNRTNSWEGVTGGFEWDHELQQVQLS